MNNPTNTPTTLPRRRRGSQPGNQKSRKRGVFDIPLSPQQRYARTAARRDGNLNPLTDRMRIKLVGLLADPHADPAILLRAAKDAIPHAQHRDSGTLGPREPGFVSTCGVIGF